MLCNLWEISWEGCGLKLLRPVLRFCSWMYVESRWQSRKLRQDRCQSGRGFYVGTRIRNGGLTDTHRLLVRDRIDSSFFWVSLRYFKMCYLVTTVWLIDSTESLCAIFECVTWLSLCGSLTALSLSALSSYVLRIITVWLIDNTKLVLSLCALSSNHCVAHWQHWVFLPYRHIC